MKKLEVGAVTPLGSAESGVAAVGTRVPTFSVFALGYFPVVLLVTDTWTLS